MEAPESPTEEVAGLAFGNASEIQCGKALEEVVESVAASNASMAGGGMPQVSEKNAAYVAKNVPAGAPPAGSSAIVLSPLLSTPGANAFIVQSCQRLPSPGPKEAVAKKKRKTTKRVDQVTRWERRYEELLEFKRRYNNVSVPNSSDLGSWLQRQRQTNRKGKLSKDRLNRLVAIDPLIRDFVLSSNLTTPASRTPPPAAIKVMITNDAPHTAPHTAPHPVLNGVANSGNMASSSFINADKAHSQMAHFHQLQPTALPANTVPPPNATNDPSSIPQVGTSNLNPTEKYKNN